jgi:hypothetical protein
MKDLPMVTRTTVPGHALIALFLVLNLFVSEARCDESWRTGFDETCAKTTSAMALSMDELKGLIEKCRQLQHIIEKQEQDETVRKVYLKRLQMCTNLYIFVLEAKQNEKQAR